MAIPRIVLCIFPRNTHLVYLLVKKVMLNYFALVCEMEFNWKCTAYLKGMFDYFLFHQKLVAYIRVLKNKQRIENG